MIDITPELIEIVRELNKSTCKLSELVQTLLGELYLIRKENENPPE